MSEEEPRKGTEDASEELPSTPEPQNEELTDVEERDLPLTAREFRNVLQRVDDLGLTWTADFLPQVRPKGPEGDEALFSEEYRKIQRQYPHLPRELGLVVYYALTGRRVPSALTGTEEELADKATAIHEMLLTWDYRAEFFFKYAIKVPYFSNVDWEVVIKAFEKNVTGVPAIPYALLSLHFHEPEKFTHGETERRTMTVAVDERLVDRIIESLIEVRTALGQTRSIADGISEERTLEEEDDD